MAAARLRIMNRTGNSKHLAALFGGEACGDERPAALRGFDHQNAQGQAADDSITLRKIRALRAGTEREFGYDKPLLPDLRGKLVVATRVDKIDAGRGDCQGTTASL